MSNKTQGVVLVAFGKASYVFAAYNMAYSIKNFNPNINVALITDDINRPQNELIGKRKEVFDKVIAFPKELLLDGVTKKFSPGRLKVNLYSYLPYDENLYLDVDGICLKDLQPLFDLLSESKKQYAAHTVGYHKIEQGKDIPSMQWAWANDIWEKYELTKDSVLPAINSSLQYISKGEKSKAIYDKAAELFENPIDLDKLRMKWGGSQPDELYMNIAMALLDYNPHVKGGSQLEGSEKGFIHFTRSFHGNLDLIADNFYIQSYYGGAKFTPSNIIEWLDKLLYKWHFKNIENHIYKIVQITKDKHANTR